MLTKVEHTVGYLKVNKEGRIAQRDGGTIVASINEVGWGDQSPQIAAEVVAVWNAHIQKKVRRASAKRSRERDDDQ